MAKESGELGKQVVDDERRHRLWHVIGREIIRIVVR